MMHLTYICAVLFCILHAVINQNSFLKIDLSINYSILSGKFLDAWKTVTLK